ncbi:hypothetical protein B9479_005761 [Cryptococcus floricola]|uniref:RanBD1 domain-containing protein n=1 Tax=Cryptococcus floricola TaxID=2591691 RepID=A0A5D3ATW2_9TREE|nr:hypothetical protein B9479_005761 [Cryptococcus floricola]
MPPAASGMPPDDPRPRSPPAETASLKRMREGSLEPVHVEEASSALSAKKNRVASSTSVLAEDSAEQIQEEDNEDKDSDRSGDEKNVTEVRKKVGKLSHEEKIKASESPSPEHQDSAVPIEEEEKAAGGGVDGSKGEGLKRKALDRNESSFSQVQDDVSSKQQKDTPSPTEDKPAPPKKQSTFASFASSSSPFASTTKTASPAPELEGATPSAVEDSVAVAQKKPATFGDFANKSPFGSAKPTPSATPKSETSQSTSDPAVEPPKKPQSTFSSFSASSSPFGSKPKQPSAFSAPLSKTSAFGNYSTTASAFGGGNKADHEKVSEEGKKNFGEILKDTKEDLGLAKEKVNMQEQDVTTGEEDEDTVFQVRAKLFVNEKGWKERGIGLLRVNVRRNDGGGARLVMRADGVLRLLLNSKLYKGLNPTVEGKTVLMTLPNVGENRMAIICLRLSNAKSAEDLADHIHEHIPLDNPSPSKSPQPEV